MININNISNYDDLIMLFDIIEEDDDDFTVTLTNMDRNYLTSDELDNILDEMHQYSIINNYNIDVGYETMLHLSIFKFTREN